MADNFFDGTLDDFLDDHGLPGLFELANIQLPLPLPLPTPSISFHPSPFGPLPFEPPAFPHFGTRRAPRDRTETSSFGAVTSGGARGRGPSVLSALRPTHVARPIPRPTQPSAADRPTPAASRQRSSNQTLAAQQTPAPRSLPHPIPPPLQLNSSSSQPSAPPNHLPLSSHHDNRTGAPSGNDDPEPPTIVASPSSAMSSRSRGHVRPGDLSMPTTSPTSTNSASRTQRRASRSSASRPSQLSPPENSPGSRKRKWEDEKDSKDDNQHNKISSDDFSDHEVVDLVDKDDVPADMLSQKTNNFVKLSALTCIICMDACKDLTVTYCGHLYCSECLHAAFNMDPTKRTCPFCRQKIDKLPANGKYGQRAKGYYALELKLMTKKTLGKKPAQSSAT